MLRSYTYSNSAQEIFDLIVKQSLTLFKKEGISKEEIKNLSIKTTILNQVGQEVSVKQKITEYEEAKLYTIETTSSKDVYSVSYKLTETKYGTVLQYQEKFNGESFLRNLNHIVMSLIYRRKIKRKVLTVFKQIEEKLNQ